MAEWIYCDREDGHYIQFGDEKQSYELMETAKEHTDCHDFTIIRNGRPNTVVKAYEVHVTNRINMLDLFLIGLVRGLKWINEDLNTLKEQNPNSVDEIAELTHLYDSLLNTILKW